MSFLLGTATRVSKECWANVAFFLDPGLAQQLLHDVHSLLWRILQNRIQGLNHFRFASLKETHVRTIRPLSCCPSFHWIHSTPRAVWIVSLARATVNDPSCDTGRMSWLARNLAYRLTAVMRAPEWRPCRCAVRELLFPEESAQRKITTGWGEERRRRCRGGRRRSRRRVRGDRWRWA